MNRNAESESNKGEFGQPFESRWYAIFTQCHHEQRVARQLKQFDVEYFLPTYSAVSRWKDRVVRLERPLFPSYLFVRATQTHFRLVLQARGIVSFVGPPRGPLPIPASEIDRLQRAIQNYPTEPADYLQVGERVRIEGGPLLGVTGILFRKTGKLRVLINVDTIMRAFTVEIDASMLSRIGPAPALAAPNQHSISAAS